MPNHPWFGNQPFLTASAFSTMAFLDRWGRGLGGVWLDRNERYFDRRREQGVRALRVFDETTLWNDRDDNPGNDHRFFNEDRSTSLRMWNYGEIARPGSDPRPRRLTAHHQKLLLKLLELSKKHDMKIELVVDATLKHTPGCGWEVIGHCIRQVAAFLRHVHRSEWVDGADPEVEEGMGNPHDPVSHERIRQMFEAVKGPLVDRVAIETHNEWDAHSHNSWRDSWPEASDAELKAKAIREVNLQLERMRKPDFFPEVAVWVSHGGRDGHGADSIEYSPKLPDAIAIHPSRPSLQWIDRFDPLEKHGVPIYLNEINHHIADDYWFTVEQGWFRPQSSTRNHRVYENFVLGNLESGLWVCDHSLVGMANGYFVLDGEWHEMPLDPFEQAMLGDSPEPPPPDPEPEPPPQHYRYARVIAQAYVDVLGRAPDPGGLENYDALMAAGMSEANLRERLIRSEEYERKNPA